MLRLRDLAALVGLLNVMAVSGTANPLSPEGPYRAELGDPVTTEIDFRVVVTAPHLTKRLRVWVPIPPNSNAQQCESLGFKTFPLDVEPTIGVETTYGNCFAHFEFNEPKGAQIIEHRLRVTTRPMQWNVDASRVRSPQSWPSSFDAYLRSDAAIELGSEVDELLSEVTGAKDASEPSADLRLAMDWLQENMVYDHSNASLAASSRHAILNRRGHCSDYHGLCAAFGRRLGYPTRVTYGLALFPKDSPSHCKLEAFLPPYGWVSFDISETQKLIAKIRTDRSFDESQKAALVKQARSRLYSGFREAAWLLMTIGTDYELAPPASHRVNVVRTIYAEADGRPLPEPDPADVTKREFAWMTSLRFEPNRTVVKAFEPESLKDHSP